MILLLLLVFGPTGGEVQHDESMVEHMGHELWHQLLPIIGTLGLGAAATWGCRKRRGRKRDDGS